MKNNKRLKGMKRSRTRNNGSFARKTRNIQSKCNFKHKIQIFPNRKYESIAFKHNYYF